MKYNHAKNCKKPEIYRAYAYDDDNDKLHKAKAYACKNCGYTTYIEKK